MDELNLEQLMDNGQELDLRKQIIEELLNEDNLETKTELDKPLRWSCLNSIDDFINSKQLPISSGILKKFIGMSYKLLISHKREGRKEYVEALKSLSMGLSPQKPINPLNPNNPIG